MSAKKKAATLAALIRDYKAALQDYTAADRALDDAMERLPKSSLAKRACRVMVEFTECSNDAEIREACKKRSADPTPYIAALKQLGIEQKIVRRDLGIDELESRRVAAFARTNRAFDAVLAYRSHDVRDASAKLALWISKTDDWCGDGSVVRSVQRDLKHLAKHA